MVVRVMDDLSKRPKPGTVLVTLPPDVDEAVDAIAAERYSSRARVVLDRLVDALRREGRLGQGEGEQSVSAAS